MLLARTGRWGYGAVARPVPGLPLLRRTSIISCRFVSQRTGSPRRRTPRNQRHRDEGAASSFVVGRLKALQRLQRPVSNTYPEPEVFTKVTSEQPCQAMSQCTLGERSPGSSKEHPKGVLCVPCCLTEAADLMLYEMFYPPYLYAPNLTHKHYCTLQGLASLSHTSEPCMRTWNEGVLSSDPNSQDSCGTVIVTHC